MFAVCINVKMKRIFLIYCKYEYADNLKSIGEEAMNRKMKIILTILGAGIITLGVGYVCTSMHYKDRFYGNTTLNGNDISGMTVEQVQDMIKTRGDNYVLELTGRQDTKLDILGTDIDFTYNTDKTVEEIKAEQGCWNWPVSLWGKHDLTVDETIEYDKDKLDTLMKASAFLDEESMTEPEDSKVEFNGTKYEIVPGDVGNVLDTQEVLTKVEGLVQSAEDKLDFEDMYKKADILPDNEKLIKLEEGANKSLNTDIVYTFGDNKEVVTPELIQSWITIGDDMELGFDTKKIRAYVAELGAKYDTLGITRTFTNSYGSTSTVSGGDFGYQISITNETNALIDALTKGEAINRPAIHTALSSEYTPGDIGNTYVEVNISSQHLWLYKDGALVTDGPVVTGNASNGHDTPPGVYKIDYKQRNATIMNVEVSYWMPFNHDVGIHDATWRSSFGGDIYRYNGSHGCVNSPFDLAKTVYENVDAGTPVIVYY